jgi:hypothetical protein
MEDLYTPTEMIPIDDTGRLAVIVAVFGNQPVKLARLISNPKQRLLAAYFIPILSAEDAMFTVPDLNDKCALYNICELNMWRLLSFRETVTTALRIAKTLYVERLPALKRHYKTLIRICNEKYGGACKKLKAFFVSSGLRNFASHCCNDHSDCSRFIWHTVCVGGGSRLFVPDQAYVTHTATGFGPMCNDMVVTFFKLYVISMATSTYVESAIWGNAHYINTTGCESYFHTLAIFIPKWANTLAEEYMALEAAAFIISSCRQKDKELGTKALSYNKSAHKLMVSAGQKNPMYERPLVLFYRALFADSTIMNFVDEVERRITKQQERRSRFI